MNETVFLFSGQGSQYVGMGKKLYEQYNEVRELYQQADDILDFKLSELCFTGDNKELTKTENAQPAILTLSIAQLTVFEKEYSIRPTFLAGHSLGEITALTVSGVLEYCDALQIVRKRGQLMTEAMSNSKGAMSAISGVDIEIVEERCSQCSNENQVVVISNINSPRQIVISGHENAVKEAEGKLNNDGAMITPLRTSAPFHSPLMKRAAEKFKQYLTNFNYYTFKYPVVSNVTAEPYHNRFEVIDNLAKQMISQVQWAKTIEFLSKNDMKVAIEFGPQSILTNLMGQQNYKAATCISFDKDYENAKFKELYKISH